MIEKTFYLGKTKVTCRRPKVPKREDLIAFYDVMNEMAYKLAQKGVDTSEWFYTEEEIKELKKRDDIVWL